MEVAGHSRGGPMRMGPCRRMPVPVRSTDLVAIGIYMELEETG